MEGAALVLDQRNNLRSTSPDRGVCGSVALERHETMRKCDLCLPAPPDGCDREISCSGGRDRGVPFPRLEAGALLRDRTVAQTRADMPEEFSCLISWLLPHSERT
jgi:hypothetical protein